MVDRRDVTTSTPPASPPRPASAASSIFPKIPFLNASLREKPFENAPEDKSAAPSLVVGHHGKQQRKARPRRGSLRKVALLGRGAQLDGIDTTSKGIAGSATSVNIVQGFNSTSSPEIDVKDRQSSNSPFVKRDASGADFNESRGFCDRDTETDGNTSGAQSQGQPPTYSSTTDEEDGLQLSRASGTGRQASGISSGSDSYFLNRSTSQSRNRFQQVKSPLSYSGLAATPLPSEADWDYSETEWWGWVVLTVTWFVFVVGMGSCLDVWSWAWDVGTTPYAPPELEDDPTLPIVGYYPALIILTGVMAWVWVVVAWVGMKYFRHAKISGD